MESRVLVPEHFGFNKDSSSNSLVKLVIGRVLLPISMIAIVRTDSAGV